MHRLSCFLFLIFSLKSFCQVPTVYCTYWTGSQEILGSLNFTTQRVDSIGAIQGASLFTVATANGYDPYRNRYYVLSNGGLIALNASNGQQVLTNSAISIGQYKHLSYNSVSDKIYLTKYNGTNEEFFIVSPETFEIESQGALGFNVFVVGGYGLNPMANEVLFQGGVSVSSDLNISTVNMTSGLITGTFTVPSYVSYPLLPAYDPIDDKYYGVGRVGNAKMALVEFRKSDYNVDTIGVIPGGTALSIVGSAIDPVTRRYIFVSNLGITSVSLTDPSDIQTIAYPPGVLNVKGFQTNYFASPPVVPRPGGGLQSVFKNINGWYLNGDLIPGTENLQIFTPTFAGLYHYKVTRPDGTTTNSNPFIVTASQGLGTTNSIELFPNPAREKFMVYNPDLKAIPYQLIDSKGQSILMGDLNSGKNEILTSSLPSGIYQFRTIGESPKIRKIVIE